MPCFAVAAGLEQYDCVDWRMQMFQMNPTDAAGKPLRFGNQAAANFNLTAQTTNLARVTMAGIVQRVRHHSRCRSPHMCTTACWKRANVALYHTAANAD